MEQKVYFKNIRQEIVSLIKESRKSIQIAVAWITDKLIINELLLARQRGVQVSIIIYNDANNNLKLFEYLYFHHAEILLSKKLMHNKFSIIDSNVIVNGSYNWTNSAVGNHENIQVTKGNTELSLEFIKEFISLKKNCIKIDSFFDYGLDNLNEEVENANDYIRYNSYRKKPFFYHETESKNNLEYVNYKLFNGYYFIRTEEEEYSFFFIKYFLNSELITNKVVKILKIELKMPKRYDYVHNLDGGEPLYIAFVDYSDGKQIYVEDGKKMFAIDISGQVIGEEFVFKKKTYENQFIVIKDKFVELISFRPYGGISKKNLELSYIDYISGIGILGKKKLAGDITRYGIVDINNKEILAFVYQDYKLNPEKTEIYMYEFPMFQWNNSNEILKYNSNQKFDPNLAYKRTVFTISDNRIKIEYNHNSLFKNTIYLSDEEDKYRVLFLHLIIYLNNFKYQFLNKLKPRDIDFLKKSFDFEKGSIERTFDNQEESFKFWEGKIVYSTQKQKEGCFVATMVYGDYCHPNVIFLRTYRDRKMQTNYLGKIVVKLYYRFSPNYVEFVKDKVVLRYLSEFVIKFFVLCLKIRYSEFSQVIPRFKNPNT